jgi:hypothetical protein
VAANPQEPCKPGSAQQIAAVQETLAQADSDAAGFWAKAAKAVGAEKNDAEAAAERAQEAGNIAHARVNKLKCEPPSTWDQCNGLKLEIKNEGVRARDLLTQARGYELDASQASDEAAKAEGKLIGLQNTFDHAKDARAKTLLEQQIKDQEKVVAAAKNRAGISTGKAELSREQEKWARMQAVRLGAELARLRCNQ